MTQAHCFLATELMLKAQKQATAARVSSGVRHGFRRQALERRAQVERWGGLTRTTKESCNDRHGAISSPRQARAIAASSVMTGFPAIVPASVVRRDGAEQPRSTSAPSAPAASRAAHDLPGIWQHDIARIMAVCDLDSQRVQDAKKLVNDYYAGKTGKPYDGVTDLHELSRAAREQGHRRRRHQHAGSLARAHRHSTRSQAGKDVYLQKPASLTIAEGRALSDAVHRSGRIFQIGSQQRSTPQFRYAAELVRNGRIGQLKTVRSACPAIRPATTSRRCRCRRTSTTRCGWDRRRYVYYTEKRVHPQVGYDRPGWLRCEQFGAGMITGWGAHHIDSAHWGMDTEYTGPSRSGERRSSRRQGLWDVHGAFRTEALLRQRRADDRQRRFSERHQVRRHRRLDLRLARQRDGDGERSGREAEGRSRALGRAIRRSSSRSSGRTRFTCPRARSTTATGSSA